MSRVIVTGATGQLGLAFQHLIPNCIFLKRTELDLLWPLDRIHQTLMRIRPQILINCAAYTAVDRAEFEPDIANWINGWAVKEMAFTCGALGARFITYSSDYVFSGAVVPNGYTEQMKTDPRSAYGKSKVIGERAVSQTSIATVIRTSWVFGDGDNFFNTMLRLTEKDPSARVPVVADQIGRPTFALDLATATLQLLELKQIPSIVHISNDGAPATWFELANTAFELVGRHAIARPISTQEFLRERRGQIVAPRPQYSVLSLARLNSLGIEMRPWKDALTEFLRAKEERASLPPKNVY